MSDDIIMPPIMTFGVEEISKHKYDTARRNKEAQLDAVEGTFVTKEVLHPDRDNTGLGDLCLWTTHDGHYYRGNMPATDQAGYIRSHKLHEIRLMAVFEKVPQAGK